MIRLKRTYEPASPQDGKRFLVERLWPRGIRKENLELDGWMKEVAPSTELRQSGLLMIQLNGMNSVDATSKN
jgi:uncharacterized protein YeaO (DUF488 family)